MSTDRNNDSNGKGFGSFGDLVSDLSDDIAAPPASVPSVKANKAPAAAAASDPLAAESNSPTRNSERPTAPVPPAGGSGRIWAWCAVIAIVGFGILVYNGGGPELAKKSQPVTKSPANTGYSQGIVDLESAPARSLEAMLAGERAHDAKRIETEAAALEKYRQGKPLPDKTVAKDSRSKNELGLRAHKAGDRTTAVKLFFEAYKLNPMDPEIAENLGIGLYTINEYAAARKAYLASLAASPKRATAWIGFGQVLMTANDAPKAEDAFALAFRYTKSSKRTRQILLAVYSEDQNQAAKQGAGKALAKHYAGTVAAFLSPILGNLTGAGVPVLLPTNSPELDTMPLPVYALTNDIFAAEAGADGYTIRLASEADCNAVYCLVGSIGARKVLPEDSNQGLPVELHGGVRGSIEKGEYRSPDRLVFRIGDVRYFFALGGKPETDINAANSALRLGPLPVATFSALPRNLPTQAVSSAPQTPIGVAAFVKAVPPAPQMPIPVNVPVKIAPPVPSRGPECDITYDIALETFGEGVTVELRYGNPGNSSVVNTAQSSGGNVHFGSLCPGSYFVAIGNTQSVSVTPVRAFVTNMEYRSTLRMQRGTGNVTTKRRDEL